MLWRVAEAYETDGYPFPQLFLPVFSHSATKLMSSRQMSSSCLLTLTDTWLKKQDSDSDLESALGNHFGGTKTEWQISWWRLVSLCQEPLVQDCDCQGDVVDTCSFLEPFSPLNNTTAEEQSLVIGDSVDDSGQSR